MFRADYSLKRFGGDEGGPRLGLAGSVSRRADILSIRFALSGDLSELSIPAPEFPPLRKDLLWEDTCMEVFLAAGGSGGYWEFNLSPSGHWNVYRFAQYREGMREEPAFASLPFAVRASAATLVLSADLDIGRIVRADEGLEAGACAVVRTVTGGTSYWALSHPGLRPDFHRKEAFGLKIPASP